MRPGDKIKTPWNPSRGALARYSGPNGSRCVIVAGGRRWIRLLEIDAGGLRVQRVPIAEQRYLTILCQAGDDPKQYRLGLKQFRRAARSFGATKGDWALLREASTD